MGEWPCCRWAQESRDSWQLPVLRLQPAEHMVAPVPLGHWSCWELSSGC